MTVLVTGGVGFIGGHLAERFLQVGRDVIVLDAMDPFYDLQIKSHARERHQNVAASSNASYRFVQGDIRDEKTVTDLVDAADYVYHQAAKAGVRSSIDAPREYNAVNVNGTLNILEAARNTDLERLVVASSSSVYGGQEAYLPFSETDPTLPVSPYGASKLAAERYVSAYANVYDLPAVVTRYFTVYGPRMRPNMAITNFVSRCFNDEPPIVYGDGTQTRDFTYIEDVVKANARLLNTDAADGETLNIGSTDTITIQTLAEVIRDQIAPELTIEYDDRIAADADHTHADITKATELINYTPEHTIREGILKFIDWYQNNRDWYEPLVRRS